MTCPKVTLSNLNNSDVLILPHVLPQFLQELLPLYLASHAFLVLDHGLEDFICGEVLVIRHIINQIVNLFFFIVEVLQNVIDVLFAFLLLISYLRLVLLDSHGFEDIRLQLLLNLSLLRAHNQVLALVLQYQLGHSLALVLRTPCERVLCSILIDVAPLKKVIIHFTLFLRITFFFKIFLQLIVPLLPQLTLRLTVLLLIFPLCTKQQLQVVRQTILNFFILLLTGLTYLIPILLPLIINLLPQLSIHLDKSQLHLPELILVLFKVLPLLFIACKAALAGELCVGKKVARSGAGDHRLQLVLV